MTTAGNPPPRFDLNLAPLQEYLANFARERNWEQFHNPKNLVMALAGEVGELIEPFQWLEPSDAAALPEHPERLAAVAEELADVMIYSARLADRLGLDMGQVIADKMRKNTKRYPTELSFGSARKHTELGTTHAGESH